MTKWMTPISKYRWLRLRKSTLPMRWARMCLKKFILLTSDVALSWLCAKLWQAKSWSWNTTPYIISIKTAWANWSLPRFIKLGRVRPCWWTRKRMNSTCPRRSKFRATSSTKATPWLRWLTVWITRMVILKSTFRVLRLCSCSVCSKMRFPKLPKA